jgi:antitoxin StbD
MTTTQLTTRSTGRPAQVMPVSEARKEISTILKGFTDGTDLEPKFIGAHRKAEAALVPISLFEQILGRLDDYEIAKVIQERKDGEFIRIPANEFAETMRKLIHDRE